MAIHHVHQHILLVTATGKTLDEAIANGIAGLTDPEGHHARLTFDSFEVQKISGAIEHKAGGYASAAQVKILLQAAGSHH